MSSPKDDPSELHSAELIDFVRDTVEQLNKLADRLEYYAEGRIAEKHDTKMGGQDGA